MKNNKIWKYPSKYERRFHYPIVSVFMENRDKHIRKFLSTSKGSLLDLGCGTGYYLGGFAKNFSKITAVDSSREMLKIFSSNNGNNARVICEDARRFSTKEKFDNVICIGLVNYFSKDQAEIFFKKIFSFLKVGGCILLTAPSSESIFGWIYKIIWAVRGIKINLYSKNFLLEKMRAAGFKKIKIKNAKDFPTFHIILEASK